MLCRMFTAHGTFIGDVKLHAFHLTQCPTDVQFHFGASTRRYKLRPPIDQNAEETIRANEAKFADISDNVNFSADSLPTNEADLEVNWHMLLIPTAVTHRIQHGAESPRRRHSGQSRIGSDAQIGPEEEAIDRLRRQRARDQPGGHQSERWPIPWLDRIDDHSSQGLRTHASYKILLQKSRMDIGLSPDKKVVTDLKSSVRASRSMSDDDAVGLSASSLHGAFGPISAQLGVGVMMTAPDDLEQKLTTPKLPITLERTQHVAPMEQQDEEDELVKHKKYAKEAWPGQHPQRHSLS